MYFGVSKNDRVSGPGGHQLKGISRNKVSVEAAIDEHGNTYATMMGTSKPTSEMISEALSGHISPRSVRHCPRQIPRPRRFHQVVGAFGDFRWIAGAGLPEADAEGEPVLRPHQARLRPACRDWEGAYTGLSELGMHAPEAEGGEAWKKEEIHTLPLRLYRDRLGKAEEEVIFSTLYLGISSYEKS